MARSVPSPKIFLLLVKVGALARSPGPSLSPRAQDSPCKDPLVTAAPLPPPQGEQEDRARYSVTQVTIEARAAEGSLPRFPQSLYRGTVALGSGVGVAVKDAADPSQPLRIQAQDPEFPVGAAWSLGGPGLPSGGGWGPWG